MLPLILTGLLSPLVSATAVSLPKAFSNEDILSDCTCSCNCEIKEPCAMDFIIIMDAATCVKNAWSAMQKRIRNLARAVDKEHPIGSKSRFSVISYAEDAAVKVRFEDANNFENFNRALTKVRVMNQGSFLNVGVDEAKRYMDRTRINGRTQIVIFMTNGKSHGSVDKDPLLSQVKNGLQYINEKTNGHLYINTLVEVEDFTDCDACDYNEDLFFNLVGLNEDQIISKSELKVEMLKIVDGLCSINEPAKCDDCSCQCKVIPGPQGQTGLPGNTGEPAPAGPRGQDGRPGHCGVPGPRGRPGVNGKPGNPGVHGKPGPVGQEGAVGPRGIQGQSGSPGENGRTGSIGLRGFPGERGDVGPNGRPGVPGRKGIPGKKGRTGEVGQPGAVGDRGDAGKDGKPGIDGKRGSPGPMGYPGHQGDEGEKGTKGPKGICGEPGEQGIQGPQGDAGRDGYVGDQGERGVTGMPGPMGAPGPEDYAGLEDEIRQHVRDILDKLLPDNPSEVSDENCVMMTEAMLFSEVLRELQNGDSLDSINGYRPNNNRPTNNNQNESYEEYDNSESDRDSGFDENTNDYSYEEYPENTDYNANRGDTAEDNSDDYYEEEYVEYKDDEIIFDDSSRGDASNNRDNTITEQVDRMMPQIDYENANIDMVFMVEASNLITLNNWGLVEDAIAKFLSFTEGSDSNDHRSFIVVVRFEEMISPQMRNYIDQMMSEMKTKFAGSNAVIQHLAVDAYDALNYINTEIYPRLRQNARRVLVVITDGIYRENSEKSNMEIADIILEAKEKFSVMISIGIGDEISWDDLYIWASDPSTVFEALTYQDLSVVTERVIEVIESELTF